MEIKAVLEQFGLTGKKADVYLAALELGGGSVIEIARKSGIKRTTTYDILLDLEKDGLISQTAKNKKRLFIGEDPEKIKESFQRKEALFNEILPQLRSMYNVKGEKPKIRFYEGLEGMKECYWDTLKYSGSISAFGSDDIVKVLGKDWAEQYINSRIKKEIYYKGILAKSDMLEKDFTSKNQEQFRSTKIINAKKYPFSNEIMIYGHKKVAIVSAKDLMGVIIESVEIYQTQKSIFQLLWDNLAEIKKKRDNF